MEGGREGGGVRGGGGRGGRDDCYRSKSQYFASICIIFTCADVE